MTAIKEQALQMIIDMPDSISTATFLVDMMRRYNTQNLQVQEETDHRVHKDEGKKLIERFFELSDQLSEFIPDDFDPKRELAEARDERYGSIS